MFTIPRMTYLKVVHMGRKGEVKMFIYYNHRRTLNGTVFSKTRDDAKKKIRKLHGNDVEFWR